MAWFKRKPPKPAEDPAVKLYLERLTKGIGKASEQQPPEPAKVEKPPVPPVDLKVVSAAGQKPPEHAEAKTAGVDVDQVHKAWLMKALVLITGTGNLPAAVEVLKEALTDKRPVITSVIAEHYNWRRREYKEARERSHAEADATDFGRARKALAKAVLEDKTLSDPDRKRLIDMFFRKPPPKK